MVCIQTQNSQRIMGKTAMLVCSHSALVCACRDPVHPIRPIKCLFHFYFTQPEWAFVFTIQHSLFPYTLQAFQVFMTVYILPDQKCCPVCSFLHDCWSSFDLTSTQGEKQDQSGLWMWKKINNARALMSSPFSSTHHIYQVPPRTNTSCSSTCPIRPR